MATVTVEYKGDALFEAKCGKNALLMDMPAALRGKDRGMTPTEIFACSLAGCVNALVAAYCHDMKIPAEGMVVTLDYDKLEKPSRLGNFRCKVRMPKGAEGWEKRKDAIHRAAERCPVHETILNHQGIEITIE